MAGPAESRGALTGGWGFNLDQDVGEGKDVFARHPDRVTQMRAKLHAWYQDVDAKFLQRKGNGPEPWRPD